MTRLSMRLVPVFSALLFLNGSQPGAIEERVSPEVRWVQQAAQAWVEAGGQETLGLPPSLQGAVRLPKADAITKSEPQLGLMIETDDPSALRKAGFEIGTFSGGVATVTAPLSRISEVIKIPGIRHVVVSRTLSPLMDVSRVSAKFDVVHGAAQPPYTGLTGAGVVVGVIDTGINYQHEDFIDSGGDNRISWIWDQTSGSGSPPSGYAYGTEWSPASIDNGSCTERDDDGHGTHVTGIAAGNGRAAPTDPLRYVFTGGAPDAEIVFVKTDFSESGVLDGVAWMMNKAGSKPCVINISLGGQFGPHDGTTLLEIGLNGLAGPGRIIVGAAGNERDLDIHAEATVGAAQTVDVTVRIPSYTPSPGSNNDEVFLDGWFVQNGNLSISVISPSGFSSGNSTPGTPIRQVTNSDGTYRVAQGVASNGDREVAINIWDSDGTAPANGVWTVRVTNNGAAPVEFDIWSAWTILGGFSRIVSWTSFIDGQEVLATPGTADSVSCVAAHITKLSWPKFGGGTAGYGSGFTLGRIAPFSSPGPRRDGVQKPLISAPGMGIGATKSVHAQNPIFTDPDGLTPDGLHTVGQGTSQATPHVTAAAALLLQSVPTMSVRHFKDAVISSAVKDVHTGSNPYNASYGFGKLDVEGALNALTPVLLLSFTASWEDGNATLRWELSETEPGARFTVERGPTASGPFQAVSDLLAGDLTFLWTDPSPSGHEPWYRLAATTRDGGLKTLGSTRLDPLVGEMRLWQNAPNPFAASTVISFDLDRRRQVQIDVIDVAGRRVRTLVSGVLPEGRNEAAWDGLESGGRAAAAGIYFYRLRTSDKVLAGRMILTR